MNKLIISITSFLVLFLCSCSAKVNVSLSVTSGIEYNDAQVWHIDDQFVIYAYKDGVKTTYVDTYTKLTMLDVTDLPKENIKYRLSIEKNNEGVASSYKLSY